MSHSYPCTNITVSNNHRGMHTYILLKHNFVNTIHIYINPICFIPQRAILEGYDWYISAASSTKWVLSYYNFILFASITVLVNMFNMSSRVPSCNSLFWPHCWNVPVVLHEYGLLRPETCRSDTMTIKWTFNNKRVGTLIVATIYLQLIQNRYMFRSFTVLQCSHQHCVQPVASDVEVVGYL